MENVRDFIVLHYLVKKENTKFWKDVQDVELPDSLQDRLNLWKYKLPTREDFAHESNYTLFKDSNFISILGGIGLYNQEFIKKEYEMLSPKIKFFAEESIKEKNRIELSTSLVGHKDLLRQTREDYFANKDIVKNN